MTQLISELQRMPIHERLQLVEDLWDSIALENTNLTVAQWQMDELDRRAANFEANPASGIPWETAKEIIRGHRG
jgi:putative addiction module component (TIGR02574 family)